MNTIRIPTILLPLRGTDMSRWAVNACDQFTSDPAYWQKLDEYVGNAPSALRLIFPEVYLKGDRAGRIEDINAHMRDYLRRGLFSELKDSFVLVRRTTQSGVRTGIVLAIDLEDYSFEVGAKTPVRSSEATILERIPPRVEIRRNAPIELPHIMLLYDDPQNCVLSAVKRAEVLYDFDLNMGGGHIEGSAVANAEEVVQAFYSLVGGDRYGNGDKLLFVVGDGNHSLAAAKACWEQLKPTLTPQEQLTHPARFALAEAVNIYDPALMFEPIHRFVRTDKRQKFIGGLHPLGDGRAQLVTDGKHADIAFDADIPNGIRRLDEYIAQFIFEEGGEVDYIHGEDQLERLSHGGVGIKLPAIAKDDFFGAIAKGGNLPRKTFSMGEGNEKRYYIEAKKIAKG